jgi:hypothetical protein
MKLIGVRNSNKTIEQLLNDEVSNGFIHRKFVGDRVRFNPKFKEHVGDKGLDYGIDDDGSPILVVGNFDWKLPKAANIKAKTFTEFLDLNFEKSNRYGIEFVRKDSEEGFDVFRLSRQEPVEENVREIDAETRERLDKQLAKGRETRVNNQLAGFEVELSN